GERERARAAGVGVRAERADAAVDAITDRAAHRIPEDGDLRVAGLRRHAGWSGRRERPRFSAAARHQERSQERRANPHPGILRQLQKHEGRRAESQLVTTCCEAGALGWSMKLCPDCGTTYEVLSRAPRKSGSSSGVGGKSTSCSAMMRSTGTWMSGSAVRD